MRVRIASLLTAGLFVAAAQGVAIEAHSAETDKRAILTTYSDIAHAGYKDSLVLGRVLQEAVEALVDSPSAANLLKARQAWLASRVPYMQTEVYRFGNAIVDDWEGKVNAWPLDEGLIDYVDISYGVTSEENPVYAANVIANTSLKLGGEVIDTTKITKELLQVDLHEFGGIEANVATGYHAVEFLLWGQDLNGTGPGAGDRSWTDFAKGDACTNGNCDRRADYLIVVTELLIEDLEWITAQWAPGGAAREDLLSSSADNGLAVILTGLGSLSYGELAGERMKLGLLLNDPEEEHDCFADNTHNSHFYNVVGMLNVYSGTYTRIDGRKVMGPALAHLVAEEDAALNDEMLGMLTATHNAMFDLKRRAESLESYDQMIGPDNPEGNAVVQMAIDALTAQTKTIEQVVATLGLAPIAFEGSDSLDNPEAVFQ